MSDDNPQTSGQPPFQPPYQQPTQPFYPQPGQPASPQVPQFPYAQPVYQQPGQVPMQQPYPQPPQVKRNRLKEFQKNRPVLTAILGAIAGLVIACVACSVFTQAMSYLPGHSVSNPVKSESPSQYKQSAETTTVSSLSKDPNAFKGKTVTFHAVVLNFAHDSNGNPVAANVGGQGFTGPIQIEFTPSLSVENINVGDKIEVWGQGGGSRSGTNAFGATIQESIVYEVYLSDSTSGYVDSSVTNPQTYISNLP